MEDWTPDIQDDTRDLVFDDAIGDFTRLSAQESVAQRLENTLRAYKKEWFLDEEHGTDWASVMGTTASDAHIRRVVSEAIFQEPQVHQILSIDISRSRREVSISVYARQRDGAAIHVGQVIQNE